MFWDSTAVQSLNKHMYGLPVSWVTGCSWNQLAPPIFPQTNMGRIRWHVSSNPNLRCWILRASYNVCEPACRKQRYDYMTLHQITACMQAQGDATPSWYGTSRGPDCQLWYPFDVEIVALQSHDLSTCAVSFLFSSLCLFAYFVSECSWNCTIWWVDISLFSRIRHKFLLESMKLHTMMRISTKDRKTSLNERNRACGVHSFVYFSLMPSAELQQQESYLLCCCLLSLVLHLQLISSFTHFIPPHIIHPSIHPFPLFPIQI